MFKWLRMKESVPARGPPKLFVALGFRDYDNEAEKRLFKKVKAGALEAVPGLGFGRDFDGTRERLRTVHVDHFVDRAKYILQPTPFSYLNHFLPTKGAVRIQ